LLQSVYPGSFRHCSISSGGGVIELGIETLLTSGVAVTLKNCAGEWNPWFAVVGVKPPVVMLEFVQIFIGQCSGSIAPRTR
jgi:hypothetical protein